MQFKEPLPTLIHSPKLFTVKLSFPDPKEIKIHDTTLRDGEQMPGVAFSPHQKYQLAGALSDLGVHILDIGFPGVSESERLLLKMILKGRQIGEIREDLDIVVMCRSDRADIDLVVRALKEIGCAPKEVTFFIFTSGSDLHLKYKIGKTLLKWDGRREEEWLELPVSYYREANIRMHCDAISYAREQGAERVEFGGEDGSRADVDYIIGLARAGFEAGGTRFGWPDTVGVLTPQGVEYYIPRIVQALPDREVVVHFHNDFGLAAINSILAMCHGIKIVSCTANGIGERAGNAPLHQVVVSLRELYGVEIPGFKYQKLTRVSRMIEEFSGIPMAVNEPIIGEGVFAHESGIHVAGLLIDREVYQALAPELVGGQFRFVYGKHSGYAAVRAGLEQNREVLAKEGIEITPAFVEKLTALVKEIRERRCLGAQAANSVSSYYANYQRLGISEGELVELALLLAMAQAA